MSDDRDAAERAAERRFTQPMNPDPISALAKTPPPKVDPEFNPPSGGRMTPMDLREFHESGLLWHVNRAALWPLGLALTITADNTEDGGLGAYRTLTVTRLDPFEPIASGDEPDEEAERAERFAEWMRKRLGG